MSTKSSGNEKKGGRDKRPKRQETEPLSDSDNDALAGQEPVQSTGTRTATGGKKSSHGGAFSTMGLLPALLRAIQKKGYRLPTPIQRKCIPPLLEGRDVVGMARTGSGKTAAFLLPLLHHLRAHTLQVGVRALILSPNRELALQTTASLKELARFTDLRCMALVGGESLEEQFVQLATNPDIVVATPGRLMHVCVETKLSLRQVQFVVWDEADRLMEDPTMASQIKEIGERLPETRQTALFSATLPQALAEFAQAGLRNPLLVRLDVESKLSPDLTLTCLHLKSEQKDAALLLLLNRIMREGATKASDRRSSATKVGTQLTVVFVATKHHVEYLQELLGGVYNLPCTYIYGALDQTARRQALDLFRKGLKPILIVTDVAARGIDVPLLDNVINYDFPPSPKLFIHRVGRVARAGRSGRAFSFVCPDELPYLFDLQLFLGKEPISAADLRDGDTSLASSDRLCLGDIPQWLLGEEEDTLQKRREQSGVLASLLGVVANANRLYRRTRPTASPESHRRAKEFSEGHPLLGIHPFFGEGDRELSGVAATLAHKETLALVQAIHQFKPKRSSHLSLTAPALIKPKTRKTNANTDETSSMGTNATNHRSSDSIKDPNHYLSYTKANAQSESGYALARSTTAGSFAEQARQAIFDLAGTKRSVVDDDPANANRRGPRGQHNGAVSDERRTKLIRTEVGTRVPASFRTDLYDKWRARTHLSIQRPGEQESEAASNRAKAILSSSTERRKWRDKRSSVKSGRPGRGSKPTGFRDRN